MQHHNRQLAELILNGTFDKRAGVPMGDAAAMMPPDPAAAGGAPVDPSMDPAAAMAAMPAGDPAAMGQLAAAGGAPMDPAIAAMPPQVGGAPPADPAAGAAPGADPAMIEAIVQALKKAGIGANGQAQTREDWIVEVLGQIAQAAGLQVPPAPPSGGGETSSKKAK